MKDPKIFGLMAEFDDVNSAITAAQSAYSAGYRKLDAYSPFPVEELSEAIGFHKNGVALICLIGGLLGGTAAFTLQWWINTISYPINIGGRPLNSWPAFIVPQFDAATKDKFFIVIFSSDKKYDPVATRQFLEGLSPLSVAEVPS